MQCILWRENSSESAQTYRMRTVTYGEASSSYLAWHYTKHEKKYAHLIRRSLMPSSGHSTWTTCHWVQQCRKNYVCSRVVLNKRSSAKRDAPTEMGVKRARSNT
uniref:Uncharacterized protein n=1 Tax=Anopheles dirus TaxID=7168 RepID=A0A182NMZ7_9DIPT